MKRNIAKYISLAVAAMLTVATLGGCNGASNVSEESTTAQTESTTEQADKDAESGDTEDISDKLEVLKADIDYLVERSDMVYKQGNLSEDKYNAIQELTARFEDIGSEGTDENMLKYNELKKSVEELKYDVSAAEDPEETDTMTAIKGLQTSIGDAEEAITKAHTDGKLSDDRYNEYLEYKSEVDGYADGTRERVDNFNDRLSEIRSAVSDIATEAEAEDEIVNEIKADPVTIEDNMALEELISNYLELQDETQKRYNAGELTEEQFKKLMLSGVDVVKIKEALSTGNITQETKELTVKVKADLKAFAESVGSDKAQYFD